MNTLAFSSAGWLFWVCYAFILDPPYMDVSHACALGSVWGVAQSLLHCAPSAVWQYDKLRVPLE